MLIVKTILFFPPSPREIQTTGHIRMMKGWEGHLRNHSGKKVFNKKYSIMWYQVLFLTVVMSFPKTLFMKVGPSVMMKHTATDWPKSLIAHIHTVGIFSILCIGGSSLLFCWNSCRSIRIFFRSVSETKLFWVGSFDAKIIQTVNQIIPKAPLA